MKAFLPYRWGLTQCTKLTGNSNHFFIPELKQEMATDSLSRGNTYLKYPDLMQSLTDENIKMTKGACVHIETEKSTESITAKPEELSYASPKD